MVLGVLPTLYLQRYLVGNKINRVHVQRDQGKVSCVIMNANLIFK